MGFLGKFAQTSPKILTFYSDLQSIFVTFMTPPKPGSKWSNLTFLETIIAKNDQKWLNWANKTHDHDVETSPNLQIDPKNEIPTLENP